ncbi:DUF5798 family protein [Halobacteriales archaeon Cl-PHB]
MGLGGTAKKLQKVANAAEELYAKMNEIIGELKDLQAEVEETSEQVDAMEYDLAEQRAVLEAIADQQGLDVDEVLADADLPEDPAVGDETAEDAAGDGESATSETA